MRKIIHYSLIGLVILVQIYLLFFKEIHVLDHSTYSNQKPLPLFGENKTVSQEFRISGPLTRIDVMLANYLTKPKGGVLNLSLIKGDKQIYSNDFPANQAEDNRFYRFQIGKVNERYIPKGNYRLQLKYSPATKKEKLAVWITEENPYPYGNLYVNGVRRDGNMTFRAYYASTVWNERDRWLNSIPDFPARAYILGGGFFLLLFMVNFLLYLLLKLPMQDKSDIYGSSKTH